MYEHIPIPAPTIAARATSSSAGSSAQGNAARSVYSAKFYDDVARIQREMDEEDAGIVRPSRGDRLVRAARERTIAVILKQSRVPTSSSRNVKRSAAQHVLARRGVMRNFEIM